MVRGSPTVLALMAAMAVLVGVVTPAQAAFPGSNGKIAFLSTQSPGESSRIHVINPDGSGEADISSSLPPRFDDFYASWSPDGTKLAFVTTRDSVGYELYTMSADGSDVQRITNNHLVEVSPSWSPDGKQLVYAGRCFAGGSSGLCRMNADGSGVAQIPNTLRDNDPSWSPDGSKIAIYRWGDNFVSNIYTIAPDGSDAVQLTFVPDEACPPLPTEVTCTSAVNPDWSPDGKRIVFSIVTAFCGGGCGYREDIYTVDRDGANLTRLTTAPLNEENTAPAWSPDGRFIVFSKVQVCGELCVTSDLFVMNADGSGVRQLTTGPEFEGAPDWQPLLGPQRGSFKNAAKFCKAERERLGDTEFRRRYGTNKKGSNAFGKCVSKKKG